ncbi:MAG: metallophosphoesterase family protein [Lachnospiraceae bacterium]|jgi:Icc-related predicted phosphoesterase|nr:metallophosphoesterase [Lachnospiraceae bacterium]MDE7059295.1 metallophosphoesterase family protein [Lachnospiraceae bacterium]
MKILLLADTESPYLWDYFEKSKLEGIDLILSCGDLHPHYLSFLATFFQGPVLYVHGNHDDCYKDTPPEGCICIDGKLYEYQGIRILGLGGSMRYKTGEHQYTQKQMNRRIRKLGFSLWRKKGFDILLTHSPAWQLNDGKDLPHNGFKGFLHLLDKYMPRYFIHGHVHLSYGAGVKRSDTYQNTTVINAYERYIIEL